MITMEQAKNLHRGQVLYHVSARNADGTPQRWRVNGAVKLWKRDSARFEIPLKHGLRGYYASLTPATSQLLCLTEAEALTTAGPGI